MTTFPDFGEFRRRPGIIQDAFWEGGDEDLSLRVVIGTDVEGVTQTLAFQTVGEEKLPQDGGTDPTPYHWICVPSRTLITDLNEDALLANMIVCSMLSKAHPTTTEWEDALTNAGSILNPKHFQCCLGNFKYTGNLTIIDDSNFTFTVRKASTGPHRTVATGHSAMSVIKYSYDPSYFLRGSIAGAIEKEFNSYVHDYPDDTLSSGQKDNIVDFIMNSEGSGYLAFYA